MAGTGRPFAPAQIARLLTGGGPAHQQAAPVDALGVGRGVARICAMLQPKGCPLRPIFRTLLNPGAGPWPCGEHRCRSRNRRAASGRLRRCAICQRRFCRHAPIPRTAWPRADAPGSRRNRPFADRPHRLWIPTRTLRSSARGTPRGWFGRSGPMFDHSKSVIS